jgi:hypothetical protein
LVRQERVQATDYGRDEVGVESCRCDGSV